MKVIVQVVVMGGETMALPMKPVMLRKKVETKKKEVMMTIQVQMDGVTMVPP